MKGGVIIPKVKKFIPEKQQEIIDTLFEKYGYYMTAVDVGRFIGVTHHKSYERWLSDVEYTEINNRKKYSIANVAAKLYNNTFYE